MREEMRAERVSAQTCTTTPAGGSYSKLPLLQLRSESEANKASRQAPPATLSSRKADDLAKCLSLAQSPEIVTLPETCLRAAVASSINHAQPRPTSTQ